MSDNSNLNNLNAASSKALFPYILDGRVWARPRVRPFFDTPDPECPVKHLGMTCWYTNMEPDVPRAVLNLTKRYDPACYPRYDNYDAIEVSLVKNIPMDYTGIMGVPKPFLFSYNPEQFEIVGVTELWSGLASKHYGPQIRIDADGISHKVTQLSSAPALEIERPPQGKAYYIVDGRYYVGTFARILIRNRHPIHLSEDSPACPSGQTASEIDGVKTMIESGDTMMNRNIDDRPEEASE